MHDCTVLPMTNYTIGKPNEIKPGQNFMRLPLLRSSGGKRIKFRLTTSRLTCDVIYAPGQRHRQRTYHGARCSTVPSMSMRTTGSGANTLDGGARRKHCSVD